jgi:hypothetical protein
MYTVYNNTTGGYAITIGYSGGSTVSIPNGYIATVFGDGTNFFAANTTSAGAFYVNGTLTAAGVADVGNLSVSGTATFSGTTTATTQSPGDSSTKVATTAFVSAATSGTVVNLSAGSLTTGVTPSTAWTVTQSSTKLIFAYGGTTVFSIDSSGNIIAKANVTAYGTP